MVSLATAPLTPHRILHGQLLISALSLKKTAPNWVMTHWVLSLCAMFLILHHASGAFHRDQATWPSFAMLLSPPSALRVSISTRGREATFAKSENTEKPLTEL